MFLPDKNGQVPYKSYMLVQKTWDDAGRNKIVPELAAFKEAEYPDELYPYWKSFLELSKRRSQGEAGPLPLSWQDIGSWASLHDYKPSLLEIKVITGCDEVWLSVWAEKHKK